MLEKLRKYENKPHRYAKGNSRFWDDPYISEQMLKAHLDPDFDGATRNLEFVERSVTWIAEKFQVQQYKKLLDLGCGPGIYGERLADTGYEVAGIDLSERSVAYAKKSAEQAGKKIRYRCGDYLQTELGCGYRLVTMIWCDFGALSDTDRVELLKKVYEALEPGGCFVFDVFSEELYKEREESRNWKYMESGFWSDRPYLELYSFYRYDESRDFLREHLICQEQEVSCYRLWDHVFNREELEYMLKKAGFGNIEFHGTLDGESLYPGSETIAVMAWK